MTQKLFGIIPVIVGFLIFTSVMGMSIPSEDELLLDTTGEILQELKKQCPTDKSDTFENCRTNIARIQGIVSLFGTVLFFLGIVIFWKA
mgnify:CR=1 FL=1|jgi:hypothetical protein